MRNLKKVIALVAVFAMMVSTVAFAAYSDVNEEHDYFEAIKMLSDLEILTGDDQDGDGVMDFRPEDTITRAEVAAIVSRIQNINSASQKDTEFTDVTSAHWASGYVAQAAAQGIINGYGDGTFGPDDEVLYEQAIKMFVETIGYTPFVEDNGGYPDGHTLAARRYGILDGVVGGAEGEQATRGQVAQMVYNTIGTCIMDKDYYGTEDDAYVFFNGKNGNEFLTLLNRDLGVKKFTGVVDSNRITTLTGTTGTFDVTDKAEVTFDYVINDDYVDYKVDEIVRTYEGDSDAGAFLGQEVSVYVREANKKGDYEVISIAPTNANKTQSIVLDQYVGTAASNGDIVVKYLKNATDRIASEIKLEADVAIIYNNVGMGVDPTSVDDGSAGYTDDVEATIADAIYDINALISNPKYSGTAKFVDNDSTPGADVMFVEIAAVGVVDEVSASGKVTFKEVVKNALGEKVELYFDDEEVDQIITLTKDGKAIEYTELKEWDVVSVLYNGNSENYVVDVMEAGKIEGTITGQRASKTSAWNGTTINTTAGVAGIQFTIEGNDYDVAANCFIQGKLGVGAAGTFYVDGNGKIVAYDKNGANSASDNYGYVLAVTNPQPDEWGEENINILLLDKAGEAHTTALADSVKLENVANPSDLYTALSDVTEVNDTYKLKALSDDATALTELAKAMRNQLITFKADSQGYLQTITFAQGEEDAGTLWLVDSETAGAEYDEENMELEVGSTKVDVTDETIVFFVNGESTLSLGAQAAAKATTSKVGTIASVAKGASYTAAIYDAQNDVPAVVVLYNTTGGVSPATNIAVIDEIGTAYVNGDEVAAVTFFMNGEKMSATTDPDFNATTLAAANQGDLWKFSLSADGTVIDDATWYGSYTRANVTDPSAEGAAAMSFKGEDTDEDFFFGPVVDYTSVSKRIRIANWVTSAWDLASYTNVKAEGANVYVFDPMRAKNNIYVGDASDVNYDKELVEKTSSQTVQFKDPAFTTVPTSEDALGMMDFVAAIAYDDEVLDVVIYKAYDFGRWTVQ